ncbi:MAG: succinate dehydrogenase assembly factor 2 [Betaproteobacteria bacterium]|nr:succinate dehydrogenase assembly factor 2 [Betaproteobacteria bacterium]
MAEIDRIRWRCRRGMLELDLILERFLERHFDRLDAEERQMLCDLLERPDPELLELALGGKAPPDRRYQPLLDLLRTQ